MEHRKSQMTPPGIAHRAGRPKDGDGGDGENRPRSRPPDPRFPRRGTPIPVGGPSRPLRQLALWLIILLVSVIGAQMYFSQRTAPVEITFTEFGVESDRGNIQKITIDDKRGRIDGTLRQESSKTVGGRTESYREFFLYVGQDKGPLLQEVRDENPGAEIVFKAPAPDWWQMAATVLPILVIVAFWFLIIRQMQSGGSAALKFGKSRAKVMLETSPRVTFADVAGCDEAKTELHEIIDFLKDPQKFARLGGRIPKGALLLGPPGTGKTLLAKAVAGEAGVPFFSMSGSDFVEMFVGVGASRVRDLFEQGKRHAPCILFVDEIDAVGRHRGAGLGGGHDEREQTLNQLLVEMDGFDSNEGVILLAATNRPDVLDPALLRPGRFDRHIVVDLPDFQGRLGILKVHTRKIPVAPRVNLEIIARGTPGMSGADLANLVNEAALLAARHNRKQVENEDFENAKDKVMLGTERRSLVLSDEEKRRTAYHEGGHALSAWLLPGSDPVHKVTIVPRGRALGLTASLPQEERFVRSRAELERRLIGLMGGRAADKLVFDELTTGAASDIDQATSLARKMVCEWGMSERLGPIAFGKNDDLVFLGKEMATQKGFSEQTAELIDREVHDLLEGSYQKALDLLGQNRDKLDLVAQTLLEREVLDGEELSRLLRGEPLPERAEKSGPAAEAVEGASKAKTPEPRAAARKLGELGGEAAPA
jgi:cell division protease FtsH